MDVQSFKDNYPNVIAGDTVIQNALDEAALVVGEGWAELRDKGIGLYAAHIITLDNRAGSTAKAAQTVTSKKVGEVQISYAIKQSDEAAWYDQTSYGQRYWQLWLVIRKRSLGCFVV